MKILMFEKVIGMGQRVELAVESLSAPRGNIEPAPRIHKTVGFSQDIEQCSLLVRKMFADVPVAVSLPGCYFPILRVWVECICKEVFQFEAEAVTDGRLEASRETVQEDFGLGHTNAQIAMSLGTVRRTMP
jgi:hypothetical protein